jgi:hypothetical protein
MLAQLSKQVLGGSDGEAGPTIYLGLPSEFICSPLAGVLSERFRSRLIRMISKCLGTWRERRPR